METIAAETDADVIRLLALGPLAAEDGEQAEQDAFISDAVEIVELDRHVVLRAPWVVDICRGPDHGTVVRPGGALREVGRLDVAANTAGGGVRVTNAEDPHLPERIVEERCPITSRTAATDLAPVNAVGRLIEEKILVVPRRHFVAARRIALFEIEPDRRRIAMHRHRDIRSRHDVERRAVPFDAIARQREAG